MTTLRTPRRGMLQGLAVLPLATAPAVALAATGADAALLALGAELDRIEVEIAPLRDRVNAITTQGLPDDPAAFEAFDVLFEAGGALSGQIADAPATTLSGLAVKARAVAHLYPEGLEHFLDRGTTDHRLASSILVDLLKIGGAA